MLILASTSDLIKVITGTAQTIHVHVSWVDLSGTTVTPGRTNTIITTATTTTVVASPAASTQRNVRGLYITNTDATTADTVTVEHTDGTNVVQLWSAPLKAGYTLTLSEQGRWNLTDNTGAQVI
jgi:hypothetical protein